MATKFGRYELVAEIGRGGMATLYLGQLLGVGGFAKPLAIKRILPHLSEDARFVEMFLNEGRIAARLSHPNICQVFELGEVDGELFLAMEYLEGVPWGELVTTVVGSGSMRDPVGLLRLAATVIGQACDGLAYAHELRDAHGAPMAVIHRDISPGNLYVTVDGASKVLDFGVSKILTEKHETRSGLIKGKLPYMPPEQVRGDEDIDGRVDVFAMGVVLWEALTGERLFVRANDYLIFKAIMDEPIPPVAPVFAARGGTAAAQLGARVDAVLARALERDRAKRYPSIRAFAAELRALCAGDVGGLVPGSEIGAIVRDAFAQRLADRSRLVAQLSAVYAPPGSGGGGDGGETSEVSVVTAANPTASIQLRGDQRVIGHRAPASGFRLQIVLVAAAAIVVGIVIAALAMRGSTTDVSNTLALGTPRIDAAPPPSPPPIDAAPDAATEIELEASTDANVPSRKPEAGSRKPPSPGHWSVDSTPYATIFIDGKRRDQTPLFRIELPPGKHAVRAVLKDGRSRSFAIRIDPGKDVSSGTLTW